MAVFQAGDRVEGVAMQTPEGGPCRLEDYRGRPLLLVYLRHLA